MIGCTVRDAYMTTFQSLSVDSTLAVLAISWFQLPTRSSGEEAHRAFEANPMLPGITLVDGPNLVGMISRGTFQKQMALPYGTALFMSRPIVAMEFQSREQLLLLAGSMTITDASQKAMERPPQEYHDPIVVETAPGEYGLLDIQELMSAQAVIHKKTIQLYKEANERWVQTTERLRETQEKLVVAAHQAGMTELAAEVLHNVGNALNGMSTSSSLLLEQLDKLRFDLLPKLAEVLDEPELEPERRAMVASGLRRVNQHLVGQLALSKDEGHSMARKLDQVIRILKAQENHVKLDTLSECCDLTRLLPGLVAAQQDSFPYLEVRVGYHFQYGLAWGPKPRLIQVLRHLLRNAFEAFGEGNTPLRLDLSTRLEAGRIHLELEDTGEGILGENLPRLFAYGFTTKGEGRGFGLHYCANAVKEMSGDLNIISSGAGLGTKVVLILPGCVQ